MAKSSQIIEIIVVFIFFFISVNVYAYQIPYTRIDECDVIYDVAYGTTEMIFPDGCTSYIHRYNGDIDLHVILSVLECYGDCPVLYPDVEAFDVHGVGKVCYVTSIDGTVYIDDFCYQKHGCFAINDINNPTGAMCVHPDCGQGQIWDSQLKQCRCPDGMVLGASGCECASDTQFNPETGTCDCPQGKVWDLSSQQCVCDDSLGCESNQYYDYDLCSCEQCFVDISHTESTRCLTPEDPDMVVGCFVGGAGDGGGGSYVAYANGVIDFTFSSPNGYAFVEVFYLGYDYEYWDLVYCSDLQDGTHQIPVDRAGWYGILVQYDGSPFPDCGYQDDWIEVEYHPCEGCGDAFFSIFYGYISDLSFQLSNHFPFNLFWWLDFYLYDIQYFQPEPVILEFPVVGSFELVYPDLAPIRWLILLGFIFMVARLVYHRLTN